MMARDINNNDSFEENELFFYSKDHLGSVQELTDVNMKPIQRYNYLAYGETKVEKVDGQDHFVKNPYAYTSREWEEETGDYYYRARYYDPKASRFLSLDPIGFSSGDFNHYRYVGNSPIVNSDPDGKNISNLVRVISLGVVIGLVDPLGCSEDKKKKEEDPREEEKKKCESEKAKILRKCSEGWYTTNICNAQRVKVCR